MVVHTLIMPAAQTPAALASTLAGLIDGAVTSDNGHFGVRIRLGRFNIAKVDAQGSVWTLTAGRGGAARCFELGAPRPSYTLSAMVSDIVTAAA